MKEDTKEVENNKRNDLPELEDESDFEDDMSAAAAYCTYLRAQSFFKRFFPKNAELEYMENYRFDD